MYFQTKMQLIYKINKERKLLGLSWQTKILKNCGQNINNNVNCGI